MVQVLPYVPSFGEKLTEAVAQGAGNLAQGYTQRLQNQQAQKAMGLLQDPHASPMQKVSAFMTLPENLKKSSAPIWAAILGPQAQSQADMSSLQKLGIYPQEQQQGAPNTQMAQQPASPQTAGPNAQPQAAQPNSSANIPGPQWTLPDLYRTAATSGQKGVAGVIGNAAKNEIERRQQEQKRFNEERDFHTKGAAKAVEHVQKLRQSIPKKEVALALAKDAVASGEVGAFSLNNLAQRFGIPELTTAKGAQLINAGKENLIANLSQVSAKAQNQWIEQRFSSMFPQIGLSKEANETMATMLESEVKIDRSYEEAFNKLEKQDLDQFGYVKSDIDRRARDIAEPRDKEIIDETSYRLREIYEREKGVKNLTDNVYQKVSKGTPLTLQNAKVFALKFNNDFDRAIEHAKKMGYRIPTTEEVEKWQ